MFGVSTWGWRNESRDQRELIRLDLVALAAEVATVARRIEEVLDPVGSHAEAQALRARGQSYLHQALLVLSSENRFETLSDRDLLATRDAFRVLQRNILALRREAERAGDSLPVC